MLQQTGQVDRALTTYQQAAKLDNKNPRLYAAIGFIYARQGNFPQAIDNYRQAISLDTKNPELQQSLLKPRQ